MSDESQSPLSTQAAGLTLATLEFSPTHHIELRELVEQKALVIHETLSADFDRERGSMMRGFDPRKVPTQEIYRALMVDSMVRDEAKERAQLAALADFDARHAKDREPVPTVAGDAVASTQAALNQFPDSGDDSNWYKANFCQPGSRPDDVCPTNLEDRTVTTPTHLTNFFSGSVFNQCPPNDINCFGTPSLQLRVACTSHFTNTCSHPEGVDTVQAAPRMVQGTFFWQFASGTGGNVYGFANRDSNNTGFGSQYSFNMRWD